MSDPRAEILARIRTALSDVAPAPAPEIPRPVAARAGREGLVESFAREAERVGARCLRVRRSDLSDKLNTLLSDWSVERVALSGAPLFASLDLKRALVAAGLEVSQAPGASAQEVDRTFLLAADAGITDADFGLADTGTLVCVSRPEQGRAISLLPPVHIAILEVGCIVENLEALLEVLRPQERARVASAITFITGPSRTADIEQTLTVGVHGPGRLAIFLLE